MINNELGSEGVDRHDAVLFDGLDISAGSESIERIARELSCRDVSYETFETI